MTKNNLKLMDMDEFNKFVFSCEYGVSVEGDCEARNCMHPSHNKESTFLGESINLCDLDQCPRITVQGELQ